MTDQPHKRGTSWKRQLSHLSHLFYQSTFYKIKGKKELDLKYKFDNLSVIFKQLLYIGLGNKENSEFPFHISEFSEKKYSFTHSANCTTKWNTDAQFPSGALCSLCNLAESLKSKHWHSEFWCLLFSNCICLPRAHASEDRHELLLKQYLKGMQPYKKQNEIK